MPFSKKKTQQLTKIYGFKTKTKPNFYGFDLFDLCSTFTDLVKMDFLYAVLTALLWNQH